MTHGERNWIAHNVPFVNDARSGNYTTLQLAERHGLTPVQIRTFMYRNGMAVKREVAVCEEFFEKETPELAYILGWIASDGCVKDNNAITIKLKSTDEEILLSIIKWIKYTNKILHLSQFDARTKKTYESVSMTFTSKKVAAILTNYGIIPRKTLTLGYPKLPDLLIRHYIRGFMDGDGHINVSFCQVGFVGPLEFLSHLRNDINRLNDLDGDSGSIVSQSPIYSLTYGGKFLTYKILNWLYQDSCDDTRLFRKYQSFLKIQENLQSKGQLNKKPIARRNVDNDKEVAQIDVRSNNVIKIFKNRKEAAASAKVYSYAVRECCLGIKKSIGGYKWRFLVK